MELIIDIIYCLQYKEKGYNGLVDEKAGKTEKGAYHERK